MTLRLLTAKIRFPTLSYRNASSFNQDHDYEIVVTDDGSTIVAWHPKADFPYEYTIALPEKTPIDDTPVLKTTMTPELMNVFNKKTPEQARQELMNITHTTKHRWFPRARDKRAKYTPMDREYL